MSDTDQQARLERYLEQHTDELSPLLRQLLAETERETGRSRWSIGKIEGRLLQMLIRLSGARRVVEVGTFTGFSALLIAEALPTDGRLITCEIDLKVADIARKYFQESPYGDRIQLELGDAVETLRRMDPQSVDVMFIDADKPAYGLYYDQALRILRPGGLVFVDNVLWKGKVLEPRITNENARPIAALNEKIRNDNRVEKVMLGIRDGVYLIRKKQVPERLSAG